eukprot:42793-Pyramimonas_sp.AAC.1
MSHDEEFETINDLLTAKHVDDINVASTEETVEMCVKCVEDVFVVSTLHLLKMNTSNRSFLYTSLNSQSQTLRPMRQI